MGHSDGEGSPIQPDGGLLSVLGDLLFAGAILIMIYPCLRRTIDRIDRHFFRQLFYILEVLLAVAALCFVLMLLIAQQMRVTYCSFIRPFVGNSPEDKIYAGVLLKILVCVLLVFNYFFASGMQRVIRSFFGWYNTMDTSHSHLLSARCRRPRIITSREALTNNSNTNSQTPVTQTQTVTHSDILSSMSIPALNSDAYQARAQPTAHEPRMFRDVGTMVRFPEYSNSLCTLQFSRGRMGDPHGPRSVPGTVLFNPTPCRSGSNLHSGPCSSTGFSASMHSIYHDNCPASVQSSYHSGSASAESSSSASAESSFQNTVTSTQPSYQNNPTSFRSSCHNSPAGVHGTYHSNPAGVQSTSQGHTANVQGPSQSSPARFQNTQRRCSASAQGSSQSGPCPTGGQRGSRSGPCPTSVHFQSSPASSSGQHGAVSFHSGCQIGPVGVQSNCQVGPSGVQSSCQMGPVTNQSRCQMGPVTNQSSYQMGPVTNQSSCLSGHGLALAGVQGSCDSCIARIQSTCYNLRNASGQSSCHSLLQATVQSCGQCSSATFRLPKQRSTVHVKRRRRLPSMPKMTRSGKIYGYG